MDYSEGDKMFDDAIHERMTACLNACNKHRIGDDPDAEIGALLAYVGHNMAMSDFQCVDHMRDKMKRQEARIVELEAALTGRADEIERLSATCTAYYSVLVEMSCLFGNSTSLTREEVRQRFDDVTSKHGKNPGSWILARLSENDDRIAALEQTEDAAKKLVQAFPETIPEDQDEQEFNIPAYIVRALRTALEGDG